MREGKALSEDGRPGGAGVCSGPLSRFPKRNAMQKTEPHSFAKQN